MFYEIVRSILFRQDPETVHGRVVRFLRFTSAISPLRATARSFYAVRDPRLEQKLFDIRFPNPVGLAAGMDKGAVALRGFEMLGFGFAEMGGTTKHEQVGNQRPRVFRLTDDKALVNRMGFNNPGSDKMACRLGRGRRPKIPLGANIGLSKITPPELLDGVVEDYCYTARKLDPFVDFFVVNVSSPNTPGLRALQKCEYLEVILDNLGTLNRKLPRRPHQRLKPILVKIAPDLSFGEIDQIIGLVKEKADGIVAVNTTIQRDGLTLRSPPELVAQSGGLSGAPLRKRALEVVRHIRGQAPYLPIIGVGGISTGDDAWEMILAGANLVELYTGFVYGGPGTIRRINRRLLEIMERNSVGSIDTLQPDTARG